MARVKTFTNGGSLLPGDLNSIEDDYEFAFSTYKTFLWAGGLSLLSPVAAGTYPLVPGPGESAVKGFDAVVYGHYVFYLNPSDRAANTRLTKYRVQALLGTNAVAPGNTITMGLFPVTFVPGAANTSNSWSLGAVVAGSTVAFATPAANTLAVNNSGDFTAPAAGYYALGITFSANCAANSTQDFRAELQYRQA